MLTLYKNFQSSPIFVSLPRDNIYVMPCFAKHQGGFRHALQTLDLDEKLDSENHLVNIMDQL
jgi:hypothetical protein